MYSVISNGITVALYPFAYSVGYFVEPTIVQTTDPTDRIMCEEIFGPVLTLFVYPDAQADEMLTVANKSTPFALTGAIFAQDE